MDMILTTQTDNCYTDLGLAEDISRTASAQRKSNHHTPCAQLLGDEKGFTQKYDILDKYGCKTILLLRRGMRRMRDAALR